MLPNMHKQPAQGQALFTGIWQNLSSSAVQGPTLDSVDHAPILVVASVLCGVFSATLACCYLALGAHVSMIFPFTMMAMCCAAVAHVLVTKRPAFARNCLCYGIVLAALGVHWSFGGGDASGVVGWALLGPQLSVMTGYAFDTGPREAGRAVL